MTIRAGGIVGAIALAAIMVFNGSASAQKSQAWKWCEGAEADGVSPDLKISGCTTVIQSGKESEKNLSIVFYIRGNAYNNKRDYARAIQDYDQAIKLNPNFADAFNNRGIAYKNKFDYTRAIQDYDQAIKFNPNNANAFYNRGNAYYDKRNKCGYAFCGDRGEYDRAIQDYDQVIKLNPNFTAAIKKRAEIIEKNNSREKAMRIAPSAR